MADSMTSEQRSWNMSRIRGKNTKPELCLRSLLHSSGYRFRLHHPGLPGRPDIVLPKYKTAIFVHGCFWHRHEDCKYSTMPKTRLEFWTAKFDGTVARDEEKTTLLRSSGWNVITVWECELKDGPEAVLREVSRRLEEVA